MEEKLSKPQQLQPSIKQEKINILRDIVNQNKMMSDTSAKMVKQNEQIVNMLNNIDHTEQLENPSQQLIEDNTNQEVKKAEKKLRSSYTKLVNNEFYKLPVTPVIDVFKNSGKDKNHQLIGKLTFTYYNKSTSIISNEAKVYKIPSPVWIKELGDYGKIVENVSIRRTNKRGFIDKYVKG
jgi:hypothetical protein